MARPPPPVHREPPRYASPSPSDPYGTPAVGFGKRVFRHLFVPRGPFDTSRGDGHRAAAVDARLPRDVSPAAQDPRPTSWVGFGKRVFRPILASVHRQRFDRGERPRIAKARRRPTVDRKPPGITSPVPQGPQATFCIVFGKPCFRPKNVARITKQGRGSRGPYPPCSNGTRVVTL